MLPGDERIRITSKDTFRWLDRVTNRMFGLWLSMTYPFASKVSDLSIHPISSLPRSHAHRIKLGNSVVIRKNGALHVRTSLEEWGEPVIIIEDHCVIGNHSMISAKNCIHLEPYVMFESLGLMQDHNHAFEDISTPIDQQGVTEGGRIRIGEGSYIGQGAVILCSKGELSLGRNCVVAPKAVVTRSFPLYSVIAGIPARIVKQFDPTKRVWLSGPDDSSDIGFARQQN